MIGGLIVMIIVLVACDLIGGLVASRSVDMDESSIEFEVFELCMEAIRKEDVTSIIDAT